MANPFVHVELHTNDLAKAKAFYSKLFGWKLQDMPMPGPAGGGTYTRLDPPGSVYSLAYGINDLGQIVGSYQKTSLADPEGFLDSGGAYTTIVPPGATNTRSFARAINNAGQTVSGRSQHEHRKSRARCSRR